MKLTNLYRKYVFLSLLFVLVIGTITHYYIFRYSIHRTTDDILYEYMKDIREYAAQHDTLVSLHELELQHSNLHFRKMKSSSEEYEKAIYDSLIYSTHEGEQVVYRVLPFNVLTRDGEYQIKLSLPTLEEDDLMSAVLVSLIVLLVLFIGSVSWMSGYYTNVLWRPFYRSLARLQRFNVERTKPEKVPKCGIDEFDQLNESSYAMMLKISNDYKSLKELTEDTSHELQTPLSILKAKLELLQQVEEDEKKTELIQTMLHTVQRMSYFNRALLLIAKINNDQFPETEEVCLNALFDRYTEDYEDLLNSKGIQVSKTEMGTFTVSMNKLLAERLIMNVYSNAIRYNIPQGVIRIQMTSELLRITNTYGNVIPEGDLFGRFVKSASEKGATGLGLTIVKKICDKSGLKVYLEVSPTEFCLILEKNAG